MENKLEQYQEIKKETQPYSSHYLSPITKQFYNSLFLWSAMQWYNSKEIVNILFLFQCIIGGKFVEPCFG